MTTYESVLDALGDRTRRQIVLCLRSNPSSVAELTKRVPVSRPAISQHLRVLRENGLVTFTTKGTRNIYQLHPAGAATLRAWLEEFWGTALDAFALHAQQQGQLGAEETVASIEGTKGD